jgi:hypothetical protein
MSLRDQAEAAAKAVAEALGAAPDPDQTTAAAEIIEKAMIESYLDAAERCATVAKRCCNEDQDMAHKIAKEIGRANQALIANLSSMR